MRGEQSYRAFKLGDHFQMESAAFSRCSIFRIRQVNVSEGGEEIVSEEKERGRSGDGGIGESGDGGVAELLLVMAMKTIEPFSS